MKISQKQLLALFHPKSVAIIGASRNRNSVGTTIVQNCLSAGFKGNVYPINPNADTILDLPCYPSVIDVPTSIDCAVVAVPADIVPMVLEQCGKKQIPTVIIISSGFKETGLEGAKKEKQLQEIAEKYEIALLGPNCLGVINTQEQLNISFAKTSPTPGHITFVSQSGATGAAILDMEQELKLGISMFASVGNEAGITTEHILTFLSTDENSTVVGCYIEQIQTPSSFHTIGKQYSAIKKPLIVLKAGNTKEGSHAAQSHTGALAGSTEAYNALFIQSGAVKAETMEDFVNSLMMFSSAPLPKDNSLGIISNAGGPAILATDYAIQHKINIPQDSNFPNPYDILGDATPDMYEKAYRLFEKTDAISSICFIITPQTMTDCSGIANAIISVKKEAKKPICVILMGHTSTNDAYNILRASGIATYSYPESGIRVLSHMNEYVHMNTRIQQSTLPQNKERKHFSLSSLPPKPWYNEEALQLLKAYNIPIANYLFAVTKEEIISKSSSFNKPVALKLISPSIIHKKKAGMIRLDVHPENIGKEINALEDAFKKSNPQIPIEGYMAMEMADTRSSIECIVGMKSETPFGKLIIVGIGGSNVEIYKDFSSRIAPLTKHDAEDMIYELRMYPTLELFDIEALIQTILSVSQIAVDNPLIGEMDINPLLLYTKGEGCVALDARFKRTEKE